MTNPDSNNNKTVPVFINPESGSASGIIDLLRQDQRLMVYALPAADMADAIRKAIEDGATRILVSGGDGTIALASSVLAGTAIALGVIPGGTLNHFAGRLGIPTDPQAAIELALTGQAQPVDVGYVNDQLFINTSSVGAYVRFVRTRDYLERRMNYQLASLFAGLRRLLRLRSARIQLDGNTIRTPLVFIGVGERKLTLPNVGQARADGQNGLHLLAVRTENWQETLKLVFNVLLWGRDPLKQAQALEDRMIGSLVLDYRRKRRRIHVTVDGELVFLKPPLNYRFAAGELLVIIPDTTSSLCR
ncbi:MAG: diacylglycerol kinase [Thiothrix lacustris]|uniref:Diacylglycerol kinase n=1 Tax=Thiothrix lacustris TaxID=525917 RepID=A0A1Y1Q8X9_9GAMM|nr:MAG: diacylglycerol kinase [Thiothrix lacustris]